MRLGEKIRNFEADTSIGKIKFHEWLGNSWGILFSHPADFTPVCTTELSRVAKLMPEFKKREIKVIALSCDTVECHEKWIKDIKFYGKFEDEDIFPYPIIADHERSLAVELGMLDPREKTSLGLPVTARAVFVFDPEHRVRLSLLYPATTGRNFDEILRAIDSLLLTDKYKVATPADWKCGEDCMVQPWVPLDDYQEMFPKGVETLVMPSGRGYLRSTPQPDH